MKDYPEEGNDLCLCFTCHENFKGKQGMILCRECSDKLPDCPIIEFKDYVKRKAYKAAEERFMHLSDHLD
jgi:hypothetical protein